MANISFKLYQFIKKTLKSRSLNFVQALYKGRLPSLKVNLKNELHTETFQNLGLNKLTPNELENLNHYLTNRPRSFLDAFPFCQGDSKLTWTFKTTKVLKEKTKLSFLTLSTIFQNEADFLEEWLEYHRLQGTDHFLLYNHFSTDNYLEVLGPYIEKGLVTLIEWPYVDYPKAQLDAYSHALTYLEGKTTWAAFIDIDEFLVPHEKDTTVEFLKDYEEFAGIAINWQLFGTSNLEILPKKALLIEHLTKKFASSFHDPKWNSNHYTKCILKPSLIDKTCYSPHIFKPLEGYKICDPDKHILKETDVSNPRMPLSKIQLNHYWFRTHDWFYKNKVERRRLVGESYSSEKLDLLIKSANEVEDRSILKFLPDLKKALQSACH